MLANLFFDFVLLVQMDSTTEGQTYVQRYQVQDFPHISIVDPRTGRLLWRKEGWTQQKNPVTAEGLAEHLMDFCSSNTFDRPPQAPRSGGGNNSAGMSNARSNGSTNKRPIESMTEEEQLEAAMRASIEPSNGTTSSAAAAAAASQPYDEVEVLEDGDSKPAAVETSSNGTRAAVDAVAAPAPAASSTFHDELVNQVTVGEEPASAAARIQFRMPDGKRVVRKFANNATVKIIYAFVAVCKYMLAFTLTC